MPDELRVGLRAVRRHAGDNGTRRLRQYRLVRLRLWPAGDQRPGHATTASAAVGDARLGTPGDRTRDRAVRRRLRDAGCGAACTEDVVECTADSPLATPGAAGRREDRRPDCQHLAGRAGETRSAPAIPDRRTSTTPNGLDADNLAALDKAVDEYAMAAAFQQQMLDSMNPTVVTQVAPPHIWFGQNVPGSRLLYDNPDTIYRFMGVNGASEYEINGQIPQLRPTRRRCPRTPPSACWRAWAGRRRRS